MSIKPILNDRALSRRQLLTGALGAAGVARLNIARAESFINEDGLHVQPWFMQDSFLELADDAQNAGDNGKHLAVMWELKGCPYCAETHKVNFKVPEIVDYMKSKFDVLQLNYIGSRLVTDFDGRERSEKEMAGHYGVRFTPTIQFFPQSAQGLADVKPRAREITRMPGYLKPNHFYAMLRYVGDEAYKTKSLKAFMDENPVALSGV